jgi:hypothetical protein
MVLPGVRPVRLKERSLRDVRNKEVGKALSADWMRPLSLPITIQHGAMPHLTMRSMLDEAKLRAFMAGIAQRSRGPGRIYLVGGASAVLLGMRLQTIDIDIKADPEPLGVFEAIPHLKQELSINVELASPDQFIPPLPGWRERSLYIDRINLVDFYHYDFYSQALAKILRGHRFDREDAMSFVRLGLVEPKRLRDLYLQIVGELARYPAVDPETFRVRVERFVEETVGPD